MRWLAAFALWVLVADLLHYFCLLPVPSDSPATPSLLDRLLGTALYRLALVLSVVRLPLALVPYLTKLVVCLLLGLPYKAHDAPEWHEIVGIAGDALNVALTGLVLGWLVGPPHWDEPSALLYLPLVAETIRLACEKGRMLSSACWQRLPHRTVARLLGRCRAAGRLRRLLTAPLAPYCHYYQLDDDDRLRYVLYALRQRATGDPALADRLAYIRSFRIVPDRHSLRAGRVRDVAAGAVFVHRGWTNDPGLLAGQALRRGPWLFDPRYLSRPFRYRSEATRLMTLAVLQHFRHCPSYAIYQFGHEIKAGRFTLFYLALRRIGCALEAPVGADGVHAFDPLLRHLAALLRREQPAHESAPLWGEAAAFADLRAHITHGERPSVATIAERYTFPRKYVAEVLLPQTLASLATTQPTPVTQSPALGHHAQLDEQPAPGQSYAAPTS